MSKTFKVMPKNWENLNDLQKQLIEVVFGRRLFELDNPKEANALLRVAYRRMMKVGIINLDPCTRCGGSGLMPFSPYGGLCFKCQGSKVKYPKTTKSIVNMAIRSLDGHSIDKDGNKVKEN